MPPAARTPLDGTDRLIVDGTNLLHRLGRPGVAPPTALVGRLRAAIPAAVGIEVVFDGGGPGPKGRVATGMHVRYAGRQAADDAILDLAAAVARSLGGGPASTARVLVVSDDRDLRARCTAAGVRTAGVAWLLGRLDVPRLASPAAGNRRPAIGAGRPALILRPHEEDERPGWRPGRGATTKTGPAHKIPRHRRHPRHAPGG